MQWQDSFFYLSIEMADFFQIGAYATECLRNGRQETKNRDESGCGYHRK